MNQRLIKQLELRRIESESTNQRLREENEERRKMENALREERDRVQRYLDIAGVILVAINNNQEVTLINKKGCEVLGYSEEEIIGKNWFDNFLDPAEAEGVKTVFSQLIEGKSEPVKYFENSIINNKGTKRLIAWRNIYLKDRNGNVIGTLAQVKT